MLGLLFGFVSAILLFRLLKRITTYPIEGKHVLITGGSSGIGLALAMEARKQGANVTIVARNAGKLNEAKDKITEVPSRTEGNPWVNTLSLDITTDWTKVDEAIANLVESRGPIHVLINCAGFAEAHYFADGNQETFERLMRLNLFGSVAVTRAALPSMRADARRPSGAGGGCICFVSSVAGQVGVFGYTAYAASKFALRGFAETLYWELLNDTISVTVAFPPDTDTPGYAREAQGKPAETEAISAAAGLVKPSEVARKMLRDVLARRFFSGLGFEGWMLGIITAGMAPADSPLQVLMRTIFCGPFHVIAAGYRFWMRCVIRAQAAAEAEAKKDE